MTTLVFLQVLEPFCPQHDYWEPDELEISLPAYSTTVSPPLPTDLNCASLSCDLPPPTQKEKETDIVSVPLTVVASSSVSDADCAPPLPPLSSLPNSTSASQPRSASVSSLSSSPPDPRPGALSADDDSVVLQKTQSDPPSSHPFIDVIVVPLSNIPSDESNCTPDIT